MSDLSDTNGEKGKTMIKVSRFFTELKLDVQNPSGDTPLSYWERVRYFTSIDDAYRYYTYCLKYGGANCALTISDGTIEHTVLSHYTDSFPEQMKKNPIMCDVDEIMSIVYSEEE